MKIVCTDTANKQWRIEDEKGRLLGLITYRKDTSMAFHVELMQVYEGEFDTLAAASAYVRGINEAIEHFTRERVR